MTPEDALLPLLFLFRNLVLIVFKLRLDDGRSLKEVVGEPPVGQEEKSSAGFLKADIPPRIDIGSNLL